MKNKSLVLLTVIALAQTGCGRGTSSNSTGANKAADTTNATVPAPAANTVTPAATTRIELKGDGLNVGGAELAFGTAPADTIQRLQAVLGAPASRTPRGDDCNAGMRESVEWSNGLAAFFTATGFVGWGANKPAGGTEPLRTAQGIAPGATRAEVEQAGLRIEETSFGLGFNAGNIIGTLDSEQPNATISEMWSGQTCAAG